jgi:hypothetical protein
LLSLQTDWSRHALQTRNPGIERSIVFDMKFARVPVSFLTFGLAIALLFSGCGKSNQQSTATESPTPSPSQPAQANNPPEPPPDQTGTSATTPPANAPATPPPAATVVIPANTRLHVRLDEDLGSKISQPGQSFGATVAESVVVNEQTIIPRGARAEGTVIDAKALGHFKGGAVLELRLERVRTKWGSYPVATSTMEQVEKGKGKRTAGFIGGGGAFGAIVGGLAGGGKGAAIGALAGAGAGTAGSAMTGNHEIFLPAETLLTFRVERPVHITEQ